MKLNKQIQSLLVFTPKRAFAPPKPAAAKGGPPGAAPPPPPVVSTREGMPAKGQGKGKD